MASMTSKLRDHIKKSINQLIIYTRLQNTLLQEAQFEKPTSSPLPESSPSYYQNLEIENNIHHIATALESAIHNTIETFSLAFKKIKLKDDYKLTVNESFADLEQLLRHSPTLLDILTYSSSHKDNGISKLNRTSEDNEAIKVNKISKSTIIEQELKHYYKKNIIPLLNIFAKLENDLKSVQQKGEVIHPSSSSRNR